MKAFQAAIAFYPLCSEPEPIDTPTLILSGTEDTWTPAELCEQYVGKLQTRHEIKLRTLAGAHHAFDHPEIDAVDAGHIVRSHPKAAAQASRMSREFMEKWL